jgi:hypothetical protein
MNRTGSEGVRNPLTELDISAATGARPADVGRDWNLQELTGSGSVRGVTEHLEALERQIETLRAEVRRALTCGDRDRAKGLRAELRAAERAWDDSLAALDAEAPSPGASAAERSAGPGGGVLLPAREQVHQALTLLGGPASPRLVVAVHDAFFAGSLAVARLTSLRRDEERSFRSAPFARPYYICAALTADLLAPARGLLAVSTWPMSRRIVGPLSPRVDYLTAAIRIADRFRDFPDVNGEARLLLWRFASNIPRASDDVSTMDPDEITAAARAELAVHESADSGLRGEAAKRARDQLDDAEQLFGSGLRLAHRANVSG